MKFSVKIILVAMLSGVFSCATATPFTDVILTNQNITISPGNQFSFVHDIADRSAGYITGTDTILSAIVNIHLTDFMGKGNEDFSFLIGSNNAAQIFYGSNINNGSSGATYGVTLAGSLADLIVDGKLNITLSALNGSYQFSDSTLTAEVAEGLRTDAEIAAVPEPGVLALIGIGLLALVITKRST